jgi:hypothetical protein
MEKLVLYCKSYINDYERFKVLLESINKYNVDNIPFYVSVPTKDVDLFKQLEGVKVISDESIVNTSSQGWVQQQIVKSRFWTLGICKNYLCLDSDCYFIKPFGFKDFMYDDQTPFTIIHEQKELFSWTVNKTNVLGFDPKDSYMRDRDKIMQIFGRSGKYYDFGPVPVLWSRKVWEDLENNYIKSNNLSFGDLINNSASEFSWYGESLLAFKSIPLYPIEPLFKVFHYAQQIQEYKNQGYTEQMIAQNYYGIIMQSNYNAQNKY